jgi:hypothetical protein
MEGIPHGEGELVTEVERPFRHYHTPVLAKRAEVTRPTKDERANPIETGLIEAEERNGNYLPSEEPRCRSGRLRVLPASLRRRIAVRIEACERVDGVDTCHSLHSGKLCNPLVLALRDR